MNSPSLELVAKWCLAANANDGATMALRVEQLRNVRFWKSTEVDAEVNSGSQFVKRARIYTRSNNDIDRHRQGKSKTS